MSARRDNVGAPATDGLMAELVCNSISRNLSPFDVGKPSELMLEVLRRPKHESGYGLDLTETVVVGDSLPTDIEMAHRGGMKSLLVYSGQTSEDYMLDPDREHQQTPTWVLNSFAEA